jgi:glycosyltransferase involved in cell wall biosynthesis
MLSFVIPTYNEEKSVGPLLDALNAQMAEGDEIIVVDSYSKDRTVDIAQSKGARVVLQQKMGIGAAKTEGARNAKNALVVMLDADCVPCADFVLRIKNHFTKRPELVALCGLDLYSSESAIWRTVYNIYSIKVFWLGKAFHFVSGKYWLAANNSAIRKDVFFSVGGYRSVVCEDNDLMVRLPRNRNVAYDAKIIATLSDRRFREGGFLRTVLMWVAADARAWLGAGKDASKYRK